jgi:hypothetical protein
MHNLRKEIKIKKIHMPNYKNTAPEMMLMEIILERVTNILVQ